MFKVNVIDSLLIKMLYAKIQSYESVESQNIEELMLNKKNVEALIVYVLLSNIFINLGTFSYTFCT